MGIKADVFDHLSLSVNCILFGFDGNDIKALLARPQNEHDKNAWSVLNQLVQNKENFEDAVSRVLCEATEHEEFFIYQLYTNDEIDVNLNNRNVSVAYYATCFLREWKITTRFENELKWMDLSTFSDFKGDDEKLLKMALMRFRLLAKHKLTAFNMLPKKFTMKQVWRLYCSIYNKKFDRRNFDRRVKKLGVIDKLGEKDMSVAKKGAYLYTFNQKKYQELIEEGHIFQL